MRHVSSSSSKAMLAIALAMAAGAAKNVPYSTSRRTPSGTSDYPTDKSRMSKGEKKRRKKERWS